MSGGARAGGCACGAFGEGFALEGAAERHAHDDDGGASMCSQDGTDVASRM